MYAFRDTVASTRGEPQSSGLEMTIGGESMVEAIHRLNLGQARILTVTGRDVLESELQADNVPGRHGAYFRRKTFKPRIIQVKLLVKADSNAQFRALYERLNFLLHSDQPEWLGFSDEPNRLYHGILTGKEVPEEVQNQAIISLEFTCHDPFKYGPSQTVTGNRLTVGGFYPTKPVITLRLTAGGSELRLLHVEKQQYIRLAGPGLVFTAGNTIVIDTEAGTITQNGRSILPFLDMVNSRFFSFSPGVNTLQSSLAGSVSSQYREVFA